MKGISCGALAIFCLLIISETGAEFMQLGLKTYYVERDQLMSWYDAWNYCAVNNMRLFSIETDLEARLLAPTLMNRFYWTSGNELAHPSSNLENRHFVWANLGRPLTYTNWAPGEPNNVNGTEHCIHTYRDTTWNDRDCNYTCFFVCETKLMNLPDED